MSTTILETPQLIKLKPSYMVNSAQFKPNNCKTNVEGRVLKSSSSERSKTMHDFINLLATSARKPIVDIQNRRGIPQYESQSFIELIFTLFKYTYTAFVAIFLMVFGILPIFDGFLGVLRFCLDKVIEINDSQQIVEKIFKSAIFTIELIILFILTTILLSLIVLPIIHLVKHIWFTAWNYSYCM